MGLLRRLNKITKARFGLILCHAFSFVTKTQKPFERPFLCCVRVAVLHESASSAEMVVIGAFFLFTFRHGTLYIYICMIIQEAPLFSITPSSFLSSDQRAPRRSPCKHTRTRAHNTDSHTLLRAVWNNITYIVLQIISRTAFRKSSALRSSGVLGQIEMARIEAKMPLCAEQVMY